MAYSANRRPRQALLWLVPVILIPLVWPASAALAGEFDLWMDGVLWQADRNDQFKLSALQKYVPLILVQGQDPDVLTHPAILLVAVLQLFMLDPALMSVGAAGLVFAAVTRNRFLALWAGPVLLFFGSIGYVTYIHLGMLWTVMCVAAAALIGAGIGRMPGGGRTGETRSRVVCSGTCDCGSRPVHIGSAGTLGRDVCVYGGAILHHAKLCGF